MTVTWEGSKLEKCRLDPTEVALKEIEEKSSQRIADFLGGSFILHLKYILIRGGRIAQ